MGVLACERYGCENIMCDRYIDKGGYICDECYKELCAVKNTWPKTMTKVEIRDAIRAFMNTEKSVALCDRDEEFDKLIRERD